MTSVARGALQLSGRHGKEKRWPLGLYLALVILVTVLIPVFQLTSAGSGEDAADTDDLPGVDRLPSTIGHNGGATEAYPLQPTIPAINTAGDDCPAADQRGHGQPGDGDGNGSTGCDTGGYAARGALATPTPAPRPSPTPSPGRHELGDVTCAGGLDAEDALFILRYVANLTSYGSYASCIGIGDVDCDSQVNAVDALGILRVVAGLSPLKAPAFCSTLSEAISVETARQMDNGWNVACPEWTHSLADVVGSFDNVNHHRVAVYCRPVQALPMPTFEEKVVIYELQGDQLVALVTFDEPIGDFPTHFDLAEYGNDPLPAFRDLYDDNLNELAVWQYTGSNCWECYRIRIFAARDHQAVEAPVVLPATGLLGGDYNHDGTSAVPQDLRDVDGDGEAELIAMDTAWELHGFCHACSPAAAFVLAWNGHEYTDASRDPRFRAYFDARIADLEGRLALGANDEYRMSFAISIALYYGHSGRPAQGWQRFREITAGLQSQCWKEALPFYEVDLALSVPEDGTIPQTSVPGSELPSCPYYAPSPDVDKVQSGSVDRGRHLSRLLKGWMP